jgi:hypothetical protein
MELIYSALAAVFGFAGAIFAHLVAHDACSRAPRHARTLILRAAARLPAFEKARFEEEWLADLEEREGVFQKFKHAFECLLCARKLAEITKGNAPAYVEATATGGPEKVRLSLGTAAVVLLKFHLTMKNVPKETHLDHTLLYDVVTLLMDEYGCDKDSLSDDELSIFNELFANMLRQATQSGASPKMEFSLKLTNGKTGDIQSFFERLEQISSRITTP